MNGEAVHNRRESDSKEYKLEDLGKRVLTWAAIVASISTCAIFYTRIVDIVDAAPLIEKRLKDIETSAAVQNDRWIRIEKFMERMDRRMKQED